MDITPVYRRADGKYEIKTPTGVINYRNQHSRFPDKDLRRTSDIEEVFDQITGLIQIQGKCSVFIMQHLQGCLIEMDCNIGLKNIALEKMTKER